jgi:nicotinate-nucleotide adenylyltransferase
MRLGLLGGTFDPPHIGHLLLAETARVALHLDRVLFLPVGDPPHKAGQVISPAQHRIAMTRLAIQDNPAFGVDTTDVDRPRPHYTFTLLPLIQKTYSRADLWLILGSDSLRDLPQWYCPEALLEQCRLVVLERPGIVLDWAQLERELPGLRERLDWVSGPSVYVSGTMMREYAAAHRSLRYLVPEPVLTYLNEHQLYQ